MSLPLIQSLWIGNSLSKLEQLCIRSFLANGHPFHLYTVQELDGVPSGTTLCDARVVLPEITGIRSRSEIAFYSDLFRWNLLEQIGGYWVDMDVVCLRPFTFEQEIVFGEERKDRASVGILRFPPRHPISAYMVHRCENPAEFDPGDSFSLRLRKYILKYAQPGKRGDVGWGEAGGPRGFRKGLAKFGLAHLVSPIATFYPITAPRWRTIFDATYAATPPPFETSYAVHLWGELVRRHHLDKNGTFPKGSLIEQLKARYK